ncbi:MAG: hypothetical protein CMA63_06145 [Euryarchaeota archaeon]|jgi:hypothetical protein|nr:hypothetical protein [Euryarchaeota archaeon]|tara:strand:+ start:4319 stop:4759 length:441 start_codon:yes stop_codon:yes gene_type:complete
MTVSFYYLEEATYKYKIESNVILQIISDGSSIELDVSTIPLDNEDQLDYIYASKCTKKDIEYWIAYILWWYDIGDKYGWWSRNDVYRAAQACMIVGEVLSPNILMDICGIKMGFQYDPVSYEEMKRRLELKYEADANNKLFREGAD